MQTVSSQFTTLTNSRIRPLFWRCLMSFTKTYTAGTTFFTIGQSLIGGADIIKGSGSVVQEWDKYNYDDVTSRVIGFEYTREMDPLLGGAILSIADITLDNHDDYFTPGSGSAIDGYVLPYRPIRLAAGFKNEDVTVFIGVTEKMPKWDDKRKTVTFHCIDFMQSIFNYPLDQAVILVNNRTDQVMGELLTMAGLVASQYTLDTGFNVIPFFYAEKGAKLGDILRKLAQSELGSVYMDETGRIKFSSRTNWLSNSEVWTFNKSKIIEKKAVTQDDLINVAEVKAGVREVLAKQKFWELDKPVLVPAGGTVEIWADFTDPVTTIDNPVYITSATTSSYTTNVAIDGSGAPYNANIALDSITKFATSAKMIFSNSHATTPVYITTLELHATPAKVTSEIYKRVEDATSVATYGELPVTIENNYLQDESIANSIAQIVVDDNNDLNTPQEIIVKGVPQLQIGDLVRITDDNTNDTFYTRKIVTKFQNSQLIQTVTVVKKTIESYFRIGISTIGGSDKIAP